MINWKECVNKSTGNEKIQNIQCYLTKEEDLYKAPIDRFYTEVRKIIAYCNDIHVLEENDFLGPLLYVGIISKTENYIREIMVECIKICPICKSQTTNHTVSFGSVMWQKDGEFVKGIFENISFSDAAAIKKELKNCLHIEVKRNELLNELLDEFDKLCQMRHAIVHSSRILAGKNAVRLNIPSDNRKVLVKIGYAQLQECASICTSCVMALNLKLFEEMVTRWAINWRKINDFWNNIDENNYFTAIWDVFSSEIDRADEELAEMTKLKCKNTVKKEFHV